MTCILIPNPEITTHQKNLQIEKQMARCKSSNHFNHEKLIQSHPHVDWITNWSRGTREQTISFFFFSFKKNHKMNITI